MFRDIRFDRASGLQELHFVNRQVDPLTRIYRVESKKDYAFGVSDAEALEIAGSSRGGKISVSERLRRSRKEPPPPDRKAKRVRVGERARRRGFRPASGTASARPRA